MRHMLRHTSKRQFWKTRVNAHKFIPYSCNNDQHSQVYASPQINFKFPQDLIRGVDVSSIMSEVELTCSKALARSANSIEMSTKVAPWPIISLCFVRSSPAPWSMTHERSVLFLSISDFPPPFSLPLRSKSRNSKTTKRMQRKTRRRRRRKRAPTL